MESNNVAKQVRTTDIRYWDARNGSAGWDKTKHHINPRNNAQMAVFGTLKKLINSSGQNIEFFLNESSTYANQMKLMAALHEFLES